MKHLAAYLLLQLGGNPSPTAKDVKGVLASVGIDADEDRLNTLISELKDKDTAQLALQGMEKLASVPSGGGGPTGPTQQQQTSETVTEEETKGVDDDGNGSDSEGSVGMGDLFG